MRKVPSYNVTEFKPRSSKYAVIIPVINEGERIRKQLVRSCPISIDFDLIIADGGSIDGSLDLSFLNQNHVRALLTKTGPGKLSAQMRMGLDFAMNEGYEGVIFIDGNDKDNPLQIRDFAKKLDEGFDHVQGSRFIKGGLHENTPLSRYLAINLIHAPLISLASLSRYTDTTNGFRAYSRRLILDEKINLFRDVFSCYELHYYLAIKASRLKFNIIEIPVERRYPSHGKTPTKISGIKGQWLVLKTLFNACLGKYDPKEETL